MPAEFQIPQDQFCLTVTPQSVEGDPASWVRTQRAEVEKRLLEHGALLFRGFGVNLEAFERLADAVSPEQLELKGGNSPRKQAGEGVFVSTEYPAHVALAQHHERSFARRYPRYILFYCKVAPQDRGETPICSSRRLMRRVDPAVVEEFRRREVMYLRRYSPEMLPWERAYDTDARQDVEAFCKASNIDYQWSSDFKSLETRHVAQGVARHPVTGEEVLFNQATAFHASRTFFKALMGNQSAPPPTHALWGDGQEIDPKVVEHVANALEQEEVAFKWQEGDVLMLDNLLATHGRRPFTGPRSILVAIRQPIGDTFA